MSALGYEHVWRPVAGATRTLIMLHGTGGDEFDLLPLAAALDAGANVLSPRGNVLEQGAPRFFRRHAPGRLDLEDLAARTQELADFLLAAGERYRFAPDAVTLVGFSNGANIGAGLLFERPESLGDAILIRAMLPYEPGGPVRLGGRHVLLLAGARDPYSRQEVSDALAAILRSGGATVEVSLAEAGHELTAADVDTAKAWLGRRAGMPRSA